MTAPELNRPVTFDDLTAILDRLINERLQNHHAVLPIPWLIADLRSIVAEQAQQPDRRVRCARCDDLVDPVILPPDPDNDTGKRWYCPKCGERIPRMDNR